MICRHTARWQERLVPGIVLCLTLGSGLPTGYSADPSSDFAAGIRPLLEEYCLRCHGGDETKGEVDLTGLTREADLAIDRDLWWEVIRQIDTEEMPSKGPFPSATERETMVNWLKARFAEIDWSEHRDPGRVTLPRLTREEYRRTLHDLLGVDLRAGAALAEDGEGESGFTNDRDALSMTAAQLEHYFESAERAIEGIFALAKPPMDFAIEAELMARSPAKLASHQHGVVIVHPDHELGVDVDFPVDGHYEFRLRTAVFGGRPCVAEIRVNGERVAAVKVASEDWKASPEVIATGFVSAGRHVVTLQSRNLVPQTPEPPDIVRLIDERARELAPRLGPLSTDESPAEREAREGMNTKAWGMQESIEWLRFLGPNGDSRKIDLRRVYLAERRADWELVRDNLAKASGMTPREIDQLWRSANRERLADNALVLSSVSGVRWEDWMAYQGKLFVDRLTIAGPVKPATSLSLGWNLAEALARPEAHPELIIREMLPRAFRRPVTAEEADRYVALLSEAQRREDRREDALATTLVGILASPKFLYREEGKVGPLDDYALASRLSYFLWQSMPDEELFDLAGSGLLNHPEMLADQAERMLEDARAEAFFENFADGWLGIRELGRGIRPDPSRFPGFDSRLARSMKTESHRFLAWWFRENRSVEELLDSRVAFLDQRLAEHYGIEGVIGEEFRPVALGEGNRRGGLLGMGSVLVVTSSPARTNPVRRGAWVMERILGENPGEALPTAGELPGNAGEARGKTLREELEEHRSREECARCHDRMDPLGFGLQNFDATGRWRDEEAGRPVDASGTLPDGTTFSGPSELKRWLSNDEDRSLARNLTRRLLAFALGRELQYYDLPLVDEIVSRIRVDGNRSRSLIREVVTSDAFRIQGGSIADPVESVSLEK